MKRITVIIGACALITSCTHLDIQKRHYRNGFYISHGTDNGRQESCPTATAIAEPVITTVGTADTVNAVRGVPVIVQDVPATPDLGVRSPVVTPTVRKENTTAQKPEQPIRKEYPQPGDDGIPANTMITLGWICTGLAVISLFVLWPLVFFAIPAVIFLILGYGKKKQGERGEVMVDVVYLKNGSVIRGTILEQIPNESLKIQTADGSVFVYKMDEIEKITKEKKSQ